MADNAKNTLAGKASPKAAKKRVSLRDFQKSWKKF